MHNLLDTIFLLLWSTVGLFVVKKYLDLRSVEKAIHGYPTTRILLPYVGPLWFVFKEPIRYVTKGGFGPWRRKYQDFAEARLGVICSVMILPKVSALFEVADPDAIKEITSNRIRFPKPVDAYRPLCFFGRNIVASEFDEWKRFRKITAQAFSERNNKLVWDETILIMQGLFETVWGSKDTVEVDHVVDITLPIALFVIGVAGFGRRISWQDDIVIPDGHQMVFKDALHVVSRDVMLKVITPQWLMNAGLIERLRDVKLAYEELEAYMFEMIRERKASQEKGRYDLFSSLLDASEEDDQGETKLSERDLLGNIFVFLLAGKIYQLRPIGHLINQFLGHETTAHTLGFTFALLALYQDEQQKLYEHIKSIIPDGRIPAYSEMNSFTYSEAVFNETLRMFPPVIAVPKYAAEDTTFTTSNDAGQPVVVPVPAGSCIVLHMPGLHYNTRYWDNPYAFKPERFLGDWPRDAFLPFSSGPRSCLGRRFFETEGIAVLTMLVSRYKIELKNEPEFASETFEERRERVLEAAHGVTLTPKRVPLVFKRR